MVLVFSDSQLNETQLLLFVDDPSLTLQLLFVHQIHELNHLRKQLYLSNPKDEMRHGFPSYNECECECDCELS
ncbi:hypothetical protein QL285_004383 [Trifolium repens]|nr:hypothetical protein QL285_004383 [Trifolium repens]